MLLAVVLLVLGTLGAVVLLAVTLVLATDRLRATVDRLVAVRDVVGPALDELRTEAERARAHVDRIRSTPLRAGDGTVTRGALPTSER